MKTTNFNITTKGEVEEFRNLDLSKHSLLFLKDTALDKLTPYKVSWQEASQYFNGKGKTVYVISDLYSRLNGLEDKSSRDVANGYATVDSTGKIPAQLLPAFGNSFNYLGNWNATTNTPTLTNGSGNVGDFYLTSTAGTFQTVSYLVGDIVVYDGSVWTKIGQSFQVSSVNGEVGDVTVPVLATPIVAGTYLNVGGGLSLDINSDGYISAITGASTVTNYTDFADTALWHNWAPSSLKNLGVGRFDFDLEGRYDNALVGFLTGLDADGLTVGPLRQLHISFDTADHYLSNFFNNDTDNHFDGVRIDVRPFNSPTDRIPFSLWPNTTPGFAGDTSYSYTVTLPANNTALSVGDKFRTEIRMTVTTPNGVRLKGGFRNFTITTS